MDMPIAVMRKFDKVNDRMGYDPEIQIVSPKGTISLIKEIPSPKNEETIAIIITRGNLVGTITKDNNGQTTHYYGTLNTVDGMLSWEKSTGNYIYDGQPPSEVGKHQYDIKTYYWDVDDAIPQALLKGTIQPGERFKP